MRSKYVLLELLPSRLDVALCDAGRVVAARRTSLTLPPEADAWCAALPDAAAALARAVEQVGAAGHPAHVLYRSPTQSVSLKSLPVTPVEAREAARLACLEALPYPIELARCETACVASDSAKEDQHQHVVVAADRDDALAAIVAVVEEAGLRFATATPIDALLIARQIRALLASKERAATLYIGENSSFFLVAGEGRLAFARQMRIGLDTIATSLTLPLQRRSDDDAIHLDSQAARHILFEHGLPARDAIVHESLGITGGQIIPLMQPVLQRFVIELRQSLRFGLSDAQRNDLRIVLAGPGSALPGFAKLIGGELHVDVETGPTTPADWSEPGAEGSQMKDAGGDRKLVAQLSLQPESVARRRTSSRLCRWMWTGAAAAIVLVAVDAVRYHMRLGEVRKQAAALDAQSQGEEQLRASTERLLTVSRAMSDLQATIDANVAGKPYYGAILKELSLLTPPTIRLTGVSLQRRDGRTAGQISGIAIDDATGGLPGLQPYIDTIKRSPLTRQVALGNVQVSTIDGRPAQRFDATFESLLAPSPGELGDDDPQLASGAVEESP